MADAPKKRILSKLFGAKKSCCCNVTIEEVTEGHTTAPEAERPTTFSAASEDPPQRPEDKHPQRRSSSCRG